MMETSWKALKIAMMEECFGKYVPVFENYEDDRKVYCNTYRMIMDGLTSLEENPNIFVRVAIDKKIEEETLMKGRVILRFIYG